MRNPLIEDDENDAALIRETLAERKRGGTAIELLLKRAVA
jgi:hypothetical protein